MGARPRETLYLLDAHSLIYQLYHAIGSMTSPTGLPTNAVFGFTRDLLYVHNEKKPTYLVCVFDPPGPTFRDQISADYKANRAPMPDDLQLQIPMIHDLLAAMRVPVLSVPNYEADDVIATLARAGERRGLEVYICSNDKDLRQLLNDRVHIFNLRQRKVYDRAALASDWGIAPEQVVDFQTLVGDTVDNVPGVPGIGPKTATQLLQKYQTLDNLLAHLDEIPGTKGENLKAAAATLQRSRSLVRLATDVPLELRWSDWKVRPWDSGKLLELFRSWGFRRFQDEVRESAAAAVAEPATAEPARRNETAEALFKDVDAGTGTPSNQVVAAWPHRYHLVNTPAELATFLERLRTQHRFAIDLETTSLDPHSAEIVGLAICWQAGEAWYLAVRGPEGEPTLEPATTLAQLKPILEDAAVQKINQNIKFDWQVLRAHGIELRGIAGDSMIADYLLHAGERSHGLDLLAEKHLNHRVIAITSLIGTGKQQKRMDEVPLAVVTEYAAEDADVAWRLCEKLEAELEQAGFKAPRTGRSSEAVASGAAPAMYLYDDLEIPLIEILGAMEFTGIRLDVPLLRRIGAAMDKELTALENDIYRLAGRTFNIGSVKQLRQVLFEDLGYQPKSRTAVTGAASTDQETLEALAKEGHELPKKLLEHRKIAKLKGTYVDALPALVHPQTGRVHTSFHQTVTATGRLSSSDPNLQNIPIRSELGGQIRQAFVPEPGWRLLTADYSQIELRLLAHFSGDEALLEAFAADRDIHALVAAQVFGVAENAVTDNMRRMAKTINFGIIYGMSAFGLAQRLEISKDEAAAFIDAYFARYPKVLEYQDRLLADCRARGFVATLLGRRRAIEGIRATTSYKSRTQPEREAINMQIQGSAADLIKVAMLRVYRRLHDPRRQARLLLQIHDELVLEAPPAEIDDVATLVRAEMCAALAQQLRVSLRVDVGVGLNWLEVAPWKP
ncbi:MAG: DNA polymerase I [Gemmataceae bacterium]|nr:DNA polymerase I [Gemmataceae bacterium]